MAKKTAAVETGDEAGDDHIAAFEKQMERLVGIAENAEFESGTLVGDIRDTQLDIFRNRPKPWSAMSETEQRDLAKALENVAKLFIKKVVIVVAEEDTISVRATLKGYSADGGDVFKLKGEARGDEQTAIDLFRMDGHDVVIMSADAQRFLGQRKDADISVDQPPFGFSDAPKGPENDEDLVAAADVASVTRINLKTGMVERLADDDTNWVDERLATPEELADERDSKADFEDEPNTESETA